MIIIASGANVSITVKDNDLIAGKNRYYAFYMNGYYDPQNGFKPCFDKPGATPRRRLHEKFEAEYKEVLKGADAAFEKAKAFYNQRIKAAAAAQKPAQSEAPAAAAPAAPAPQPQQSGLAGQLEQALMRTIAEMSVGKVVEDAKATLEQHIIETFGMVPVKHEIITPAGHAEINGVVHERFDTLLNLVSADIPVFLTGPAGTGKNVLAKQIAEALKLEFYFSNAVTQEYKITGFIDANGTFHGTQFYDAFTKGGLFMLDEMDASIPEVLVMLNAAIANRYFDFPTGRVEAHEDFRLIAAGNTFGTGADIEYTGRYQLDAASLDRFAMVEVDYSPAIESSIARGDNELVEFIHAFRKAAADAGIKALATYRSIERIKKLDGLMPTKEAVQICLVKGMAKDDLNIIVSNMRNTLDSLNKYFLGMKKIAAGGNA